MVAFLSGDNIYLREVQVADVSGAYYRWMNDTEITQYLESRFHPNPQESIEKYVKNSYADPNNVFLGIFLKQSHRHIGNIKLGPVNWIHRNGDIGIIIGEKDCWGKGYASEAIRMISDHAFNVLNLHKVTAGCYEMNKGSIRAFEKAGFQIEGIRKAHA
ncbi:N-acetyltransferase, partial [archaeon]|nr:N-acetyltransferase [archaeon]